MTSYNTGMPSWNQQSWGPFKYGEPIQLAGLTCFTGMARLTPCFLVKLWLCRYKGRADPLAEISARATGISSASLLIQTQQKLYRDTRHLSRASPIKRGNRANRAGSLHINSFNSVIAKQKLSLRLVRRVCFRTQEKSTTWLSSRCTHELD